MGSVSEHGRCRRCERLIESDSPSHSLCVACYDDAAGSVPFDGGEPVLTPEEWTDIILDAELERYLDLTHDDAAGERS